MNAQLHSLAAMAHLLTRHVRLWAALGLLTAFALGPTPAQAAVTEAWVHRYSNVVSNSDDQAVKVVRDTVGDVIVTGTTLDHTPGSGMLTIKYSGADGSMLWQKRYTNVSARSVAVDGSGNVVVAGASTTVKYASADGTLLWEQRYNGPANSNDFAQVVAVAVDASGNVVVTGFSGNYPNDDYYTAKYAAADGALLWEQRYSGPGNYSDSAAAVAVDASGNVVVTGRSVTGIPGGRLMADYYTAKYAAADGALLWEQRYNRPGNHNEARAVAVDGSGNVVVTGYSHNGTNTYYYTAKYAGVNGALLWENLGPVGNAESIAVDGSGNVVATGFSYNATNADYYTAKYAAADGALLWEQRYSGPGNSYDFAQAVAVDASGNVVVTGRSATGFSGNYYNNDYYTAKYAAADGALLWEKRYNGPANSDDSASAVAVDGSGNVVVTGPSYGGGGGGNFDYYTAKYAVADGALLWEHRYTGLSKSYNEANAVVVDGSGNLVVTGHSEGNGSSGSDYYTAKYAAADGALLWEQRYNGPANGDDSATAVAVDGRGNVVVTGYSFGTNYNGDYYTAKYAAANGGLLWEQRYNGPANEYDIAMAVAVDSSGNVVVAGSSSGTNSYRDYYTAKYAAVDGALLWEQRYISPANDDNYPTAVAVDGSGNVVVTGVSDAIFWYEYPPYQGDYYTAKYAAADGALLWEKRYNGPANYDDAASAVVVDGRGNVVVTGHSSGTNFYPDFYTAKYAAADGALLWERRYTNGGAQAVAVDGSGNVVVTGYSFGTNSPSDYYTAKYAAVDGALLWEKRYNSPANTYNYDSAQAVAVDGSGNVVVTGSSYSGTGYNDYYTAKYAAANGALLWEKRYNSPANGDDYATSLALGPNGMVAVTGSSGGDYATVVYRDDVYPISIALIPAGVRLRFIGIPGRSYTIERALAVTGPWTAINTQTAPTSGFLEYLDAPAPPGFALYRTVQP